MQHGKIQQLIAPHVDSFNYFLDYGLEHVVECLDKIKIRDIHSKTSTNIWISKAQIGRPKCVRVSKNKSPTYPKECRENGLTYKGELTIEVSLEKKDGKICHYNKNLGAIPIMVRSKACWLAQKTKHQLIAIGEEDNEFGGYFICNGIERLIRMFIEPRRNYVIAMRRDIYAKRCVGYTEAVCTLRCVRRDSISQTIRCHYLLNGTVDLAFSIGLREFFLPVGILIKCLVELSDAEIFEQMTSSLYTQETGLSTKYNNHYGFVCEKTERILELVSKKGLRTRTQCLSYVGKYFRSILRFEDDLTDLECGLNIIKRHIFLHVESFMDKINLLYNMLQKLYALVNFQCQEDDPDALSLHEILQPNQILCKLLHEKLEDCSTIIHDGYKPIKKDDRLINRKNTIFIQKLLNMLPDVGKKFEYFICTGNFPCTTNYNLQQSSGLTILAERLNFLRYLSHYRSVHRGSNFAEVSTTSPRKLSPTSWGFICPVHTPDGAPCGILNHLTEDCSIVKATDITVCTERKIISIMLKYGMISISQLRFPLSLNRYLPVFIDGLTKGFIQIARIRVLKILIRTLKIHSKDVYGINNPKLFDKQMLPWHLEVVHIPNKVGGPFPGFYFFTNDSRLIRPVLKVSCKQNEFIGTMEQQFMNISCPDGGYGGSPGLYFTHTEIGPRQTLSLVAGLIPYSEHNQSPRNTYQSQMSKQTIGTPSHDTKYRMDTKIYRLQSPQAPILRTEAYDKYNIDEYPSGTNTIVAVLSYTGYDMEDAIVVNKAAVDLGIFHAIINRIELLSTGNLGDIQDIYKKIKFFNEKKDHSIDNNKYLSHSSKTEKTLFECEVKKNSFDSSRSTSQLSTIDPDGLSRPGVAIYPGDVSYIFSDDNDLNEHFDSTNETYFVENVVICATAKSDKKQNRTWYKSRTPRRPSVGDKFASRAGQKGVLSKLWPDIDMPFSERSGIRPDLIINPNAFPSRMTIGMLIEALTSKVGALEGKLINGSPFQKSDELSIDASDKGFSDRLEEHGFRRSGGEVLLSGISGEEFGTDIYLGSVYYQRLRHMVNDKLQVREKGPVCKLTRQPVKGRKAGGGIRFGEMERDALLAHGAAYLLHERLHISSDSSVLDMCSQCGYLLGVQPFINNMSIHLKNQFKTETETISEKREYSSQIRCQLCSSSEFLTTITLPSVFKFLAVELAAMNVKLCMHV
eukprot:gnl/TRDRNA2_/TRDRNA2_177864_c0_seq2.p1 gnl/TRDRNA2_/TRDRNA2_177864_c0~~gnl/TRDRNA2_/TRDRNA2_177864_c0_seq2.p1  ORF type:complete len:1194 (+),score=-61.88 gnl/TRDRNA2_/TRDRNA2_177864_c0_seq2:82-3663(+)